MSIFLQIISVSATVASLCMVASPIITVNSMRAANSVGVMTITFFCAQFLNCNVWAMYGVQTVAYPVIICNVIGCAIAAYCILTFLTVARLEEKSGRILKATTYRASLQTAMLTTFLIIGIMLLIMYLMNFVSHSFSAQLNGILGGCCGVFMLSSPLGMAKDIIKNKNAEPLQPITVIFATFNSVLWTLYGLLIMDMYITVPNTLCTLACFFQIFLLVRYGRRPSQQMEVMETLAPVPMD